MSGLVLLIAVAMPLLLGVPAVRLLGLGWRTDRIGFPAWCWLAGCLVLAAVLRLCRESGLPHGWWWAPPLLVALALEMIRRRRPIPAAAAAPPPGLGFSTFVVFGALLCAWFALAGMDRPCIEGDEGNIWSLKAKSLLVDWGEGFGPAQEHNLHPDYPQLNPWLQTWVYALTGVPDFVQFENRWLVQLCSVALFVATAAALRRCVRAPVAAVLAALVLLEPEFQTLCRTAYADGMVALGLVVATDCFLRWRAGGPRGLLWLAGLGLAFALWSKNETMLYLASAGGAAIVTRLWCAPLRGGFGARNLLPLAPALLVAANTRLFNARFGLQSDLFGANRSEHAGKTMFELMGEQWRERVPALLGEAWRAVASLDHIHAVFGLLALAIALAPRVALGRELAVLVLAICGAFVGLHVIYAGSYLPLRMHLDTSHLRVLFQLVPATLVVLAACWRAVAAGRGSGQTRGHA